MKENPIYVGIGKILGYAYTGEDWHNAFNTYEIHYQIIDHNGTPSYLYSFKVPMEKCDNQIKQKYRMI